MNLLDRYRELLLKVDLHSARIFARYGDRLACAAGCGGCCTGGRTVFPIEAEAIAAWIEEQGIEPAAEGPPTPEARAARRPTVLDDPDDRCAFLDSANRCRIYPVRPLVCRSHGLPLAVEDGEGGRRGDVCPLSFQEGQGLAEVAPADFLDQPRLDTILAALEVARARGAGEAPGRRVPLESLAG